MKSLQRKLGLVAMLALLLSTSACKEQAEVEVAAANSALSNTNTSNNKNHASEGNISDFKPVATLQEIMLAVIDPNVDPIWNSISTESDADGVVETRPETDEEWQTLRNHTITLREAANLLIIPGRKVAHPETSTSIHHSELESHAIEELIKAQWPAFIARARALQDAAHLAVEAIDARDVDRLEEVGGIIEHSCEGCHSQFWYPGDKVPDSSP